MTTPERPARVIVKAPARLHFGTLDLRGHRGRRFGGIGAAIPSPAIELEATPAAEFTAEGPDAGRALEFARRFGESTGIRGGAHLRLRQVIPAHAGLGSGTQLGLSVARALAELYGQPADPTGLARAVGRGRRSAIGTWTFALGGFVLEGGRHPGSDAVAPLLTRLPIPAEWWCVVAIPKGKPGLSGQAEEQAFVDLPPAPEREVERVAHLVLMQLLPALADGDLEGFGHALSEIQQITGGWYAPAQGGRFAPGGAERLIAELSALGAVGVGQSSWGPTVYGLVSGQRLADEISGHLRQRLDSDGVVISTPFSDRGAHVSASWVRVGPD
jgi:beta-ribofuranosylaminobenzene 5'-phosphate synthase